VHHRVANPIAIAHVPEDAAKIGDEESASQRMSPGRICGREESPKQRHQREPRKNRAPRRHGPGNRKRQLEQSRGKPRSGPRLPVAGRRRRLHTPASVKHSGCGRVAIESTHDPGGRSNPGAGSDVLSRDDWVSSCGADQLL